MATRPNRTDQLLIAQGLAAHALATEHAARVTPRLTAGLVDGLAADLTVHGALVPGALSARQEKKGATATVATIAGGAAARIASIRSAITHAGLSAGSRKAWGVGQKVQARVVSSVIAAATVIASRASTAPEEARAAGILAADLAGLAAAATALGGADLTQENSKRTAKTATAARNIAGRRILDATRRIATAGQLEFHDDADIGAEFTALLSAGTKQKAAPKPVKS